MKKGFIAGLSESQRRAAFAHRGYEIIGNPHLKYARKEHIKKIKVRQVPEKSGRKIKAIFVAAQNNDCLICGKKMNSDYLSPRFATFDHITPRCFGGQNEIKNLIVVCKKCNSSRGHKPFPVALLPAARMFQEVVHGIWEASPLNDKNRKRKSV